LVTIAVHRADIGRYNLPVNEVKSTDTRAVDFVRKYGSSCVELDALRPDVIQQRIEDFILQYLNLDAYEEVVAEEERQRNEVVVQY
jgi:hypothetical protein